LKNSGERPKQLTQFAANSIRRWWMVMEAELEAVNVKKHIFHGDWNYTLHKRKIG
jgi:hypothetical protein